MIYLGLNVISLTRHALQIAGIGFLTLCLGCSKIKHTKSLETESITPLQLQPLFHNPESIGIYLKKSHEYSGEEKTASLLQAAGKMLEEGYPDAAEQILTSLPPSNIPQHQSDHKLLRAMLALNKKKTHLALQELGRIHQNQLSKERMPTYYYLLSKSYAQQSDHLNSALSLIPLQAYPPIIHDLNGNIFRNFYKLPLSELNTLTLEYQDPTVKAWLELVLIYKKFLYRPKQMATELNHWGQTHLNTNPIAKHFAQISRKESAIQNIALLLPLQGALEKVGHTLKQSFTKIYNEQGHEQYRILLYDTSQTKDISQLYDQAVQAGAHMVVGPIEHHHIETLTANRNTFPIPTLLLNYVDNPQWVHENVYQLSFNPRQEAQAVAKKIYEEGYRRPLIIAPNTPWGQNIKQAFIEQWKQNPTKSPIQEASFGDESLLDESIKQILSIDDSYFRKKELQSLMSTKLSFYPARRQDMDVIFLVSNPVAARQIKPLLSFYYAGNVPTYAISSLYTGQVNPSSDMDLDQVIFCDIPYVFTHPSRKNLSVWSEYLNSQIRLEALALDAYLFMTQLNLFKISHFLDIPGSTGFLRLNSENRIVRTFEWGQFYKGTATLYT